MIGSATKASAFVQIWPWCRNGSVVPTQTMGEHQQAIKHARRWVTLDPLHGPAQHLLLQLLADAGQPAAALRQYAAYADLLEEELGLPVEDEIDDLQRQIRAMQALQPLGVSEPFSDTEVIDGFTVAGTVPFISPR